MGLYPAFSFRFPDHVSCEQMKPEHWTPSGPGHNQIRSNSYQKVVTFDYANRIIVIEMLSHQSKYALYGKDIVSTVLTILNSSSNMWCYSITAPAGATRIEPFQLMKLCSPSSD